jgi:hypothetical protein
MDRFWRLVGRIGHRLVEASEAHGERYNPCAIFTQLENEKARERWRKVLEVSHEMGRTQEGNARGTSVGR